MKQIQSIVVFGKGNRKRVVVFFCDDYETIHTVHRKYLKIQFRIKLGAIENHRMWIFLELGNPRIKDIVRHVGKSADLRTSRGLNDW